MEETYYLARFFVENCIKMKEIGPAGRGRGVGERGVDSRIPIVKVSLP